LWVERAFVGDNEKDGGKENLNPTLVNLSRSCGKGEGDC